MKRMACHIQWFGLAKSLERGRAEAAELCDLSVWTAKSSCVEEGGAGGELLQFPQSMLLRLQEMSSMVVAAATMAAALEKHLHQTGAIIIMCSG